MTADQHRAATEPVVDALVQVSFAVLDVLTGAAAEHDSSVTQLRLLGILRDRTPSMAVLAGFLRVDRSSVSGLIDRAEARGLVVRRTSPEDARVTTIHLTEDGVRLAERVATTVGDRMEQLLRDVPASQRARLVAIAGTIVGAETGHSVR